MHLAGYLWSDDFLKIYIPINDIAFDEGEVFILCMDPYMLLLLLSRFSRVRLCATP